MAIILTIVISYYVAVFVGWFIHFFLHCELFGFKVYKYHLFAHHKKLTIASHSDMNRYNIIEHLIWLSFIVLANVLILVFVPLQYSLIFLVIAIIYGSFFYYVHDNVHFKHSFLNRYKWFRKLKARHLIHHRWSGVITFKKPLSEECPNIAFGGPVGGIFIDRIFKAEKKL